MIERAEGPRTSAHGDAPRLAFLVVEYGTASMLPQCLEAIEALEVPRRWLEVIVVDNASPTPVDAVRDRFGAVHWLGARRNLGFAGGCSLALSRATAPVIACVNPDCVLDPGWASAVLRGLEDRRVGVVGSKIYDGDGRRLSHAGGRLFASGRSEHLGDGEIDGGQWDEPADVTYVTGAAFAVRRAVLEEVGFLSPAYFPAYYEETELCVRARAAGWRVRYLPEARALHRRAAASGGEHSDDFLRRYHEGRLRFVLRNYAGLERARFVRAELQWRARMSVEERRIASSAMWTALRTFNDETTHAPRAADVRYEQRPSAHAGAPS